MELAQITEQELCQARFNAGFFAFKWVSIGICYFAYRAARRMLSSINDDVLVSTAGCTGVLMYAIS